MTAGLSATSAFISPSYSKSTRRLSRICNRLLHLLGPVAERIAEGGIGQHRHARLEAEPTRHAGRLLGDIGNLLRMSA
jgi:hypothetical protein